MIVTGSSSHAIAKVLFQGAQASKDNRKVKDHLQRAFRTKLTGARSGRVYTTYFFTDHAGNVRPIGTRPPHQASAPGEPPARDTGELIKSMRYSSKRLAAGGEVTISAEAKYAAYLEFGTSKMAPRPYFRSTIREESNNIRKIWRDGIVDRERKMARQLGGAG